MISYPRTSPFRSEWEGMNPLLVDCFNMPVPERFDSAEKERENLKHLALCDLSALSKFGIKGEGSGRWLEEQGILLPEEVYQWVGLGDEGLIVSLDRDEYFLEEGFEGATVRQLYEKLGEGAEGCFRLNRQDAGLFLCGSQAYKVLRQACSHDFSNEKDSLVMTQLAAVSCAILPSTIAGVSGFRIWLIPSYAIYLWQILFQIVKSCGGHAVGIGCLKDPPEPD